MTAFLFSIVVTVVLVGLIVQMARRRPAGTPLTWGEAFIGGAFIFFVLLMIYGVVALAPQIVEDDAPPTLPIVEEDAPAAVAEQRTERADDW